MSEEDDIQIGTINMGQTMAIMAISVRAMIQTFIKPDDPDEDKAKLAIICFSIFLQQYISAAKKPELYGPILQIVINEVCNAQPSESSIEHSDQAPVDWG